MACCFGGVGCAACSCSGDRDKRHGDESVVRANRALLRKLRRALVMLLLLLLLLMM